MNSKITVMASLSNQIIGPDNPTRYKFSKTQNLGKRQTLEKEFEDIMERTRGKEKM